MNLSPIVLFTYNRPWHVLQTLEALAQNTLADQSVLYIYCDGPKENATPEQLDKIKQVREIAGRKKWCKEVYVIEQPKNKGLAPSVIDGVTEIVNRFEKIIVIEDDVLTSRYFLQYMNEGLHFYEREERVFSLGSWNYFSSKTLKEETFFLRNPDSIAWATWKRAWDYFEPDGIKLQKALRNRNLTDYFNLNIHEGYNYSGMLQQQINGKVNSWAIRWLASVILQNGLALYPARSLTKHIGFGNEATHCKDDFDYNKNLELSFTPIKIQPIKVKENRVRLKDFVSFEKRLNSGQMNKSSLIWRSKRLIKRFISKVKAVS